MNKYKFISINKLYNDERHEMAVCSGEGTARVLEDYFIKEYKDKRTVNGIEIIVKKGRSERLIVDAVYGI